MRIRSFRLDGGHIEIADVQKYGKLLQDRLCELNERLEEIIDPRLTARLVRQYRRTSKTFNRLFGASVSLLGLGQRAVLSERSDR